MPAIRTFKETAVTSASITRRRRATSPGGLHLDQRIRDPARRFGIQLCFRRQHPNDNRHETFDNLFPQSQILWLYGFLFRCKTSTRRAQFIALAWSRIARTLYAGRETTTDERCRSGEP